jgi:XRE family transcriptional regulator, fatty acid utilization regulator
MERVGRKSMLGHKVRRYRLGQGLSQVEMATEIGISASYLNLIEHNHRPVTVSLLFKLGQVFDIDLKAFAEDEDARLAAELSEVFSDQLFEAQSISQREILDLVGAAPAAAQATSTLYQAYRLLWERVQDLTHMDGGRDLPATELTASPVDAVRDVFQVQSNHFAELETAAETLWRDAGFKRDSLFQGLVEWLEQTHAVTVRVMPIKVMGATLRRFDQHRRRLLLSEALHPSGRVFHAAVQVAYLGQASLLDELVDGANLPSEEARALLRQGLAGYFAGAVMMPYDSFRDAAAELRHDLELLRRRFAVSFEQVSHRLTTLQRPGARGVTFFFLRIDRAGNVSKRLSGGGFQFARFGGTCPRWIVHDAFKMPGSILTQIALMPDDSTFFTIARTLNTIGGWNDRLQPEFALALGCEIRDAKQLVYADGLLGKRQDIATPVGVSCRVCDRLDCSQRAYPPMNHRLTVEEHLKSAAPFSFVR